ncbi:MAG: divergent polysaccharide deacetylase family protein [Rhizobiaceae bacterium]|nr:divergent polysaccharide deacetylase family protein [Rhizobiaceae bacterium]
MPAFDDLDAPLGQKPQKNTNIRSVLASIAFLVIAAIGGGAYFLTSDKPQVENPIIAKNQNTSTAKVEASATLSNDNGEGTQTGPGELTEIEPEGEISEHVAAPTKRPSSRELAQIRQKLTLAHIPDRQLSEQGATGIIPKRSPDGLRAMDVYSRPPLTEGSFGVARVVLIVGGMGISQSGTQQAIRQLPGEVTFAFAPYGNSLGRWMQAARKSGHELLLQIPMEPFGYPQNSPGIHTLRTNVSPEENFASLHWSMSRLTNYVGVMNYLGGKLMGDDKALRPVFNEIAERGLLFVEDGSINNSLGEETAKQSLLPYTKAHILIDRINSRAEIAKQLNLLAKEAKRTGLAIGIANAFPESIKMIAQFVSKAKELKLEITPVSAIVSDPGEK